MLNEVETRKRGATKKEGRASRGRNDGEGRRVEQSIEGHKRGRNVYPTARQRPNTVTVATEVTTEREWQ